MSCMVEGGVKREASKGHRRNWDFVLDAAVHTWKYQAWIIWPNLSV